MSLFGNLKSDGLEETQDRLGGYSPYETNIYSGPIKVAYAGISTGGAQSVTLIIELDGREYRETLWVTNKKKENFFLNKDDPKKKVPLPGFTVMEDLCQVTIGEPLSELKFEDKMVKIYDADLKKEVPKSMPVAIDLIGKVASFGIVKAIENKSVKDSNGVYQPTAETRIVNFIDKVFHTETRMTTVEARNGTDPEKAGFWDAWLKRNQGQERDRREIKDGSAGQAGRPTGAKAQSGPPQGNAGKPRTSLFGPKA